MSKRQLDLSEQIFNTIFEQSPISTQIFSPTGETVRVNKAWEKLWGVKPDQLGNYNILRDKQLVNTKVFKYIEEGFSGKIVKVPPHKYIPTKTVKESTAPVRWVQNYMYPIKDTDGKVVHIVMQHEDITESKKAEEDQARLAAIVESSNDAIISKSLDGIITSWNKAAQEMYGYSVKEVVGQHIYLIVPKELRKEEDTILAKLKRGEYIDHFETTRVRRDGKRIAVSLTISPIRDTNGTIIGASKIARDITETKTARERQEFLEKLTTALSQSLDEHVTLGEIAKLIVPFLADYCRIVIIDKHNNIQEITVNHKNPKKVQLTKELFESYVHDTATVFGVPHILKTGKPEIIAKITDTVFQKYRTNKNTQDIVKAIGLTSYMGMPLLARGKTIGAITFSSTRVDRIYTKNDLRFAKEIAARIGLTLDNVRLYKEATGEITLRKRSEARKSAILQTAIDAIISMDHYGRIIEFNPAAEHIFGYTQQEILGKPLHEIIIPPALRQQHKTGLQRYLLTNKPHILGKRVEMPALRKDGTIFPVELAVTRVAFEGSPIFTGYIRNITEEKKAEEELKKFKFISDNANDALLLIDKEGCIIYANKYACFSLGYNTDELLGAHLSKINRFYIKEDFSELFRRIHREYVPPFEAIHKRKNGTEFPVEVSVTNISFNEQEFIFSVVRDITERKQLEQRKNEFISVASHELKTPVTSIKVYAQVLHKRFLQGGDTKSAEHLAKMDAQLTKLTNLIVDLLDISKIESGKLQFTPVDFWFDELVQEVVEEMQRITNRHNIVIQGKAHIMLHADNERIGQVIINFISNAVKYSPEADTIIVHIAVKKTHIELCVEDFGVGIPGEKQGRVFERFYRVSGPKEDTFPGLGLGLYISSEIIKRQGGKIWVESDEGQGSRFCFSLPLNKSTTSIKSTTGITS